MPLHHVWLSVKLVLRLLAYFKCIIRLLIFYPMHLCAAEDSSTMINRTLRCQEYTSHESDKTSRSCAVLSPDFEDGHSTIAEIEDLQATRD